MASRALIEMGDAEVKWCHAVADEFKSRWVEQEPGEVYLLAEFMLQTGAATINTPINDGVALVDKEMGMS